MILIKSKRYVVVELEENSDTFDSRKEYYDSNGKKVSKPKGIVEYKHVYVCDGGWMFGGSVYSTKEEAVNAAIHSSVIKSSPDYKKFTADEIFDAFDTKALLDTVFVNRDDCVNNHCGIEELSDCLYDVLPDYLGVYSVEDAIDVCAKAKNPKAKAFMKALKTAKENAEWVDKYYSSIKVHKKSTNQSLYKIYPTENVDNYQYKSFSNDEEASNFCEINGYVRYKEIKEQPFEKRLNSSKKPVRCSISTKRDVIRREQEEIMRKDMDYYRKHGKSRPHYNDPSYVVIEEDEDGNLLNDNLSNIEYLEYSDKILKPRYSSVIKSSAIESFPVSEEEAEDIDDLRETFPDKEDLRVVLEDYFHIYDDYAQISVQEFNDCFEDYMKDEVASSRIIKSSLSDTSYEVVEEDNVDNDGGTYFILVNKDPWCIIGVDVSGEVGMDSSYYNDVDIGNETYRKYGEWDTSSLNVKSHIYSVEFNIDEETVDEETFMKALKLTKEEFDTLVERIEDLAMGTWEDWVRENYNPE